MAETALLKPLDCPGDPNNCGKMSPSPQKEGHLPWEEPPWLQRLPGTGAGCYYVWVAIIGRVTGIAGTCIASPMGTVGEAGVLVARAPELPAKTGPSLSPSLSSIPCCPRLAVGTRAHDQGSL